MKTVPNKYVYLSNKNKRHGCRTNKNFEKVGH